MSLETSQSGFARDLLHTPSTRGPSRTSTCRIIPIFIQKLFVVDIVGRRSISGSGSGDGFPENDVGMSRIGDLEPVYFDIFEGRKLLRSRGRTSERRDEMVRKGEEGGGSRDRAGTEDEERDERNLSLSA
jgi:hypothetical protein